VCNSLGDCVPQCQEDAARLHNLRVPQGWNNPENVAKKRLAKEKKDAAITQQPATGDLGGRSGAPSVGLYNRLRTKLGFGQTKEQELDTALEQGVKGAPACCKTITALWRLPCCWASRHQCSQPGWCTCCLQRT
jgi:hypothetical protein